MPERSCTKEALKHIVPPPIKSFMREVTNIISSIWSAKADLSRQLEGQAEAVKTQSDELLKRMAVLEKRTETLCRLFDAANEENRRLYALLEEYQVVLKEQQQAYLQFASELASCRSLCEKGAQFDERLLAGLGTIAEGRDRDSERLDEAFAGLRDDIHAEISSTRADVQGVRGSVAKVMRRQDELLDPALYPHALTNWYQNETGEILNLEDPQTYNEKIQWLKLYDRTELKSRLMDKVRVRDWVAEKIGPEYLIDLYGVYRSADEIDFEALPNAFALKANHGSGWNAIVKDKSAVDLNALKAKANLWLKADYAFSNGFELAYSDIPRRLLAEELLTNSDGDLPDYKVWCFAGRAHYIEYISGRGTNPTAAFFTRDWSPAGFCTEYRENTQPVPAPDNLDEMIRLAEVLAEGFAHVRVDLYRLDDGSIKFGEMTFSTSSGAIRWNPPETDLKLGQLLVLPTHSDKAED